MLSFNFWQKWLFVIGIYLSFLGLFLVFFNQSDLMNLIFNNNINPAFWDSTIPSNDIINFQSWIYGVLGATITGWGIFLTLIVHYPFKLKEKWAWNTIALGVLIWFLTDSYITFKFHVTFNNIFNLILLIFIGIPLIFTKKYFK